MGQGLRSFRNPMSLQLSAHLDAGWVVGDDSLADVEQLCAQSALGVGNGCLEVGGEVDTVTLDELRLDLRHLHLQALDLEAGV